MATRRKSSTTPSVAKRESVSSSTIKINSEQRIIEVKLNVQSWTKIVDTLQKLHNYFTKNYILH